MNQRSFFKSLALIGAAAVGCPGIFIPQFEPVKWKVERPVIHRCTFTQWLIDLAPRFDAAVLSEWGPQITSWPTKYIIHDPTTGQPVW